eukprot:TRINITY_DN8907_c0_g1_i1.p1 TRINITY_DN8907_c0_g1~~TRINITY_DN8907_c0_g1_i1.p1  ORF type:complete len:363 (-),score=52.12 TRINITY_DN8907_c0_g1_i1:227-1261(-)
MGSMASESAGDDIDIINSFADRVEYRGFIDRSWGPYAEPLLHQAAEQGRADVVKAMLRTHWDPLDKDREDLDFRFDEDASTYDNAGLNYKSGQGRNTPLHFAAYNGHLDVVKVLLAARADVDPLRRDGRTPLMHASANNQVCVLQHLFDSGAALDLVGEGAATALSIACQRGHHRICEKLIGLSADVNIGAPLCVAVEKADIAMVTALLAARASVNAKTDKAKGVAPLCVAVEKADIAMVTALLAARASVNAKTDKAKGVGSDATPLKIASKGGNPEVIKLIMEMNPDDKDAQYVSSSESKHRVVTPERMAEINAQIAEAMRTQDRKKLKELMAERDLMTVEPS